VKWIEMAKNRFQWKTSAMKLWVSCSRKLHNTQPIIIQFRICYILVFIPQKKNSLCGTELAVTQIIDKFPAIYENQRFTTIFTRDHHPLVS
jgi:hypothetical protein